MPTCPRSRRTAAASRSSAGRRSVRGSGSPSSTELEQSRRLTGDDDGLWNHVDPAWSPDGTTICYTDFRHLWLIPADGGPARPLTSGDVTDREPVWSASGEFVYCSSHRDHLDGIYRVSVSDGAVSRYTTGPGPECHPAVSADGRLIVYSAATFDRDILVIDRRTGATARFGSARQDQEPAIAPDGSGVAYISDRLGTFDLWYQPLEMGKPAPHPPCRLTEFETGLATPSFSPDGRWVAFFRVVNGERDIWAVSILGGAPLRLTEHSGRNVHPTFSRDGSLLAFVTSRPGTEHVWIWPMAGIRPTGEPWQLTDGEGEDETPVFSPDGKTIAFVRRDDIWVVPVERGAHARQVTDKAEVHLVVWDADGRQLLATGLWGRTELELRTVRVDSGASQSLTPRVVVGGPNALGWFSLTRDGRYLAIDSEELKGNLWTVGPPVHSQLNAAR